MQNGSQMAEGTVQHEKVETVILGSYLSHYFCFQHLDIGRIDLLTSALEVTGSLQENEKSRLVSYGGPG